MIYKIAFRNILRNRRRSAMAGLALSVGAVAMLLFGAFMVSLILGVKTSTIASNGHLTIFHKGYLDYGSGNPGAYAIDDYEKLIQTIRTDPVLGPMTNVVTPRVSVFGIAGNYDIDASKTFVGEGFVPSAYNQMHQWDEYHILRAGFEHPLSMSDANPTRGVLGVGLARILGYCTTLHLSACGHAPAANTASASASGSRDFSALEQQDAIGHATATAKDPQIDLLGATASGAPNVVSLNIAGTNPQSLRELDDSYVGMPLTLAQQLLFGRGEKKATSIIVQLHHTSDLTIAKQRLQALLSQQAPDLEVQDFIELTPFYKQVIALFGSIFTFITIIMCLIVLFSVANTMGMSVMERTSEIGTLRAMGVQRGGIRQQFLAEGLILGFIGATFGVVLSIVVAAAVNRAGLQWLPPGQTYPVPLRLLLWVYPALVFATWLGLVAVAAMAAWVPANRAARMTVVNAIRYA
jgi:putative ABC transport system permease protein